VAVTARPATRGIGALWALAALFGLAPGAHGAALGPGGSAFPAAPPRNVPGELIVRFRTGTTATERRDARQDADTSLDHPLTVPRAQLLEVDRGQTVADAVRELERDPDVLYAEPNRRFAGTSAPDDPSFGDLWGLNNTGQVIRGRAGLPGADIDALGAWTVTTGSPSVLVAIVDTGFDRSHEDLAANAWTNPGESGAKKDNGVDDDGNGLVDDWRGWDFDSGDNDPHDGAGHGTHVAGTVGAVGGNGIGVTGVSPHVSLVGVKVLGDGGFGTTESVAEGLAYAGRLHARVANASLGSPDPSQLVADAIAGAPETLFVVAAGNDGTDVDSSPFSPCVEPPDNIVCVAATDNNDELAGFSNFGQNSVDLAAPGVDILSSVPGDGYAFHSGTSMASPHVTGAAALLAAAYPGESPLALKGRLLAGARPIPELTARTASGGRLDLGGALGQAANPPPVPALVVTPAAPRIQQRITLDSSGSTDDGSIVSRDWDLDGNGSYETRGQNPTATTVFEQHGDAEVGLRLRDDRGNIVTKRVPLFVEWPPVDAPLARFEVGPTNPVTSSPVTFDASPSHDDHPIAKYEWDLDGDWTYEVDGGTDPRYSKTFARGTWTVGLRVTDSDGTVSETRVAFTVRSPAPTVSFEVSPAAPRENETIEFIGHAHTAEGPIVDWRWWIDSDGQERDDTWDTTYRRYDSPRTIRAYLSVWNQDGEVATASREIEVGPGVVSRDDAPPAVTERPGASDGDGAIEPGEGIVFEQGLRNRRAEPATGISGTLHAPEPTGDISAVTPRDIVPGPSPAVWPDLPSGAAATPTPSAPLTADTYGSLECGASPKLELSIKTDQGETTLPVRLPPTGHTGTPVDVPETYYLPLDVKPVTWVYVPVRVELKGAIKDLDVRIDDLRHSRIGDVQIAIEEPEEEIFDDLVTLVDRRGGDGDDMVGTILDSDAATPVEEGQPPFTGRFRPESSLDQFDGHEASGDWGIRIANYSTSATAHVNSLGLDVSPAVCDDARNASPSARLSAPLTAEAGVPITLDASGSTDDDGHILEYRWDLDGVGPYEESTKEPLKTVTFHATQGWNEVGVQVVDDSRATDEARTTVRLSDHPAPEVRFTGPDSITAGHDATFDGSGSTAAPGRQIASWWWESPDRDYIHVSSEPQFTANYAEPGWHVVSLRVADGSGAEAQASRAVWVGDGPGPPGVFPSPFPGLPSGVPIPEPPHAGAARPPLLRFHSPGRVSLAKLARGLPVTVACEPGCDTLAELRVTRSVAGRLRQLGRHGASPVVASSHRKLRSGVAAKLRLRIPARTRRSFARMHSLRLRLSLTAGSPDGVSRASRAIVVAGLRRR
jgi:subtilisin family serine protease/subtilisin-like proprotein convertase family protein